MLLALLAEEPRHGYELIRAFDSISQGFYSPSPGVLYPALGNSVQLGHAELQSDGKRKRYSITDQGREYLAEHRQDAERLFARLRHAARKMAWMQSQDPEAASQATGWLPEFVEARASLRAALFSRHDADFAEQRRVAAILRHAVEQIEAGSCPPGRAMPSSDPAGNPGS